MKVGLCMTDKQVFMTETDTYLFGNGTHYEIYNKMGSHLTTSDGKKGVYFSVWAPTAREVYVFGEFNDWNETQYCMKKISSGGVFDLFVPGVKEGQLYKYLIISRTGRKIYKAGRRCFPRGSRSSCRAGWRGCCSLRRRPGQTPWSAPEAGQRIFSC